MPIEALRTAEARFDHVPDFPYAPHYVDDLPGYETLRAAFIDEGPKGENPTFLCLHGEPTWSFLYRRMIPVFLESGARVVAPDFLGFGRSDKPIREADYTFHFHRNFLIRLIERLDLHRITLVVQDWGGLLGLTLPVAPNMQTRIERLLVMDTDLAVGKAPSDGFVAWRGFVKSKPDFAVGALIKRATPHLTDEEVAAYDAPFPDQRHKAGVRRFPELVMTDPSMEGVEESLAAERYWSHDWAGKSFMAWGGADPVLDLSVMEKLRRRIRGCPEPLVIAGGGHFIQEWGEEIARAAISAWS